MMNRDEQPSITEVKNQCSTCEHQNPQNPIACQAFPEGIPVAIFMGFYDHTVPYIVNGEVMDHGITYAPRKA